MHNPLRSEREVFRAVVVIGIGAGAVIALALLTRPAFGAVLLAAEVGLGIGVLWRRARGTLPHQAEVVRRGDAAYRVLVMANQTVGGRALLEEIKNRCQGRDSEILVVVPALTSSPLRALGFGRRWRHRGSQAAPRGFAAGDGVGRPDGARRGRGPPRAERGARGRPSPASRRRGDHLDPSGRTGPGGSSAGWWSGRGGRCRCRSPTWSWTSRRRRRGPPGPRGPPPDRPPAGPLLPLAALLARVFEQELDQGLEVLRADHLPEVLGHDPGVALGDLGVRVDDRLLHLGGALPGITWSRSGPGGAGRAGRLQGVAAGAPLLANTGAPGSLGSWGPLIPGAPATLAT